MEKLWIVGGDDVLHRFIVSREFTGGGIMAREWIMSGEYVKVFRSREAAEKSARRLNKYITQTPTQATGERNGPTTAT